MTNARASDGRLWTSCFALLLLVDAAMQLGMYLTRPIVSSYAIAFGATLTLASFLGGLNATVAMAMRPVTGFISDLLSKKALLMGSCALFAVSSFGCAMASTLPLITLLCALQGVAFAVRSAVTTGMVALVVPREKLAAGVGLMGVSYTVGGALGPSLGAFIGKAAGYPAAFAVAGVLFSIGLVLASFIKMPARSKDSRTATKAPKTRKQVDRPSVSTLFHTPAIPLSLAAGLLMVAHGSMNSLAMLLVDMGLLQGATLYFALYAFVSMASKPLAGRIADKRGLDAVAAPSMLLAAAGMALLACERNSIAACVAALCMGLGQAAAYSSLQAEAVRQASEDEVGRAANTFFVGPDLGMGLGPIASGFVLGKWGVEAMFLFTCSSVLLGTAVITLWCNTRKT